MRGLEVMELLVEIRDVSLQFRCFGRQPFFHNIEILEDKPIGRQPVVSLLAASRMQCSHLPYSFVNVRPLGQLFHFVARELKQPNVSLLGRYRRLHYVDFSLSKDCLSFNLSNKLYAHRLQ